MLQKHEYQNMLELLPNPAFIVDGHTVQLANRLALSAGFTPDSSILECLSNGSEDYTHLAHGCQCATIRMQDTLWNASIVRLEDLYLFQLDQAGLGPQLKSLLLISTELRLSLSNLSLLTNSLFAQADNSLYAAANREMHKILRVLNNVSNVARYVENRDDMQEEINICSALEEFMEECATLLEKANITLRYTLPKESIYTMTDWQMLRQAVYALLDNAAKHTNPGGVIEVTLTKQDSTLRLTVIDSGPGIPKEAMPNLFSHYTRDPSLENSHTGLGLGLTLARCTAIAHGGTVLVDSHPGCGTRVTLTLAIRQNRQLKLRATSSWVIPAPDDGLIMLSNVLPTELYVPKKQ